MSNSLPPADEHAPHPEPVPLAEEPIVYRPISGWAIASVLVGGLFAGIVAISTVAAFWRGAPVFFPPWTVSLAIVGVVLALLGQRRVQNSEGTRAGAKLARFGLWLSLVSGLGYLSYYFFTGLAVQNQAYAFLTEKTDEDSGFFPRLLEGARDPVQLNSAFLLTRLPRQREGIKPENEREMRLRFDASKEGGPGDLSIFKYAMAPQTFYSALPRIFFGDIAKDVVITDQGVHDWKYEQKSYVVQRKFRVETKEVEWLLTLTVVSADGESAGQGRRWYVNLPASGWNHSKLTPFGETMSRLRSMSRDKLYADLRSDKAFPDIKQIDRTEWDNRFGDDFANKRAVLHQLFAKPDERRFDPITFYVSGQEVGRWEDADGKLRFYHSFRLSIPKALGQPPAYSVDAYAVHESDRVIDPGKIGPTSPLPEWNLVRLVVTNIGPFVVDKKGKMPG